MGIEGRIERLERALGVADEAVVFVFPRWFRALPGWSLTPRDGSGYVCLQGNLSPDARAALERQLAEEDAEDQQGNDATPDGAKAGQSE